MATPARFSTKNHVFDGTDFSHWCSRMQSYIMAEDYDIWRKVSHPYVIPEAINTAAEKTAFEQNCKARNILLSGISRSDYDRVTHFRTAHEIWNVLSNFHQGTNNIKELRRDIFKKEYIKFEMKPGEALNDYLSRFIKILSYLRSVDFSYDTNYPQSEISRHFLNGLDMSIWEMKVTSIQKSVNMSTLTLDSLYRKLKTHEMNVLSRKVDSKSSALVSSSSYSLDVDAFSSKPSFLAVFNVTSDDQLEQIEEEDLAFVANRILELRIMPGTGKELGRGKREDKDGEKTNNNKPKGSSQGRKLENLRKAFQQVSAAFEPQNDVDGESGDDDKGKNISDVCFVARGESDTEYEDNELKQPHDVLDCSTCNLNKLKLKDALGRVEFMEDVVKNNEVLSCPKCRKSKGVMVDYANCANLEKEVSYLKNSLLRFSDGKKNLNMILDQSKVLVLEVALVARKENVWIVDSGCSQHMTGDKNWFSSLKKASKTESIIFGDASTSAVLATGLVKVHFKKTGSKVFDSCGDSVLNISRYGRVFKADFENPVSPVITCLVANFDKDMMFWHRRLGHFGFDHLTMLSRLDLVRGLPKLMKDLDLVYTPCHHAKMVAYSHAPIVSMMTDAPGQLLHMDTVGPARVQSVGGKWYVLVIVDHFSRYSWVFFMATKDEAFQHFRGLFLRLDLEFPSSLKRIRSDNGGEFKNASFEQFSNERGTLSQVQGEDGRIFEDESNDNDDDEITTSTSTDTERGSTLEVASPLHIQRRHPLEQIIGNIGERTTRSKVEVYVKQPPCFENPDFPNHVIKLSKALYGLKQAPRAWYDRLKNFLLVKGFTMGKVDKTPFVLKHGDNQLFVQIYVNDIIFGCSTHALVVDFAETMHREFEMSMMGELSYFLGLQIKQTPQGTFVHQTKYTKDLLRRFKKENCKPISTPIGSTAVLDPDEDGEAIDQKEYRSMIGSLLYLTASRPDIQFAILWLLFTLKDYGLIFEKVPLFCDNTNAINVAKNRVQHSRTKHIDIRFHFLRDHVEKGDVELQFLDTKLQLADIFTKPLDSNRFAFLCGELGIIHPFGMV
uniref:Retrotransposon protein, putative, unclassified n=1 Tax=Oryza sativa subsp. japonica TaxID=39947 RepID=Q339K1_ORYSJ|nr:retrotransposon protein, putative, unclassified [Oryza sativa Japonica Group]